MLTVFSPTQDAELFIKAEQVNMVIVHPDTCDLCGTCVGICPFDAIELTETQLSILHTRCTLCNRCVEICPVEALYMNSEPASLVKP